MPRKESVVDVAVDSPTRRRGPKPLVSMEQESRLVQWALVQQSAGRRVSRDDVIAHAQELLRQDATSNQDDNKEAKPGQTLGLGWCNRLVARHPELSLRSSNAVPSPQTALNVAAIVNVTLRGALPINGQEKPHFKAPDTLKQSKTMPSEAAAAMQPIKTRKYNRKHMEAAVAMYLAGKPMSEVTQRFPLLHQRTIRRRVLRVQRGEVDKRRGPRPLLEGQPEHELVAWILDMQSQGTKVTKQDILVRANEQYRALTGGENGENRLKEGWLRRFKERHPVLSGRAPVTECQKEDDSRTEEEKIPFRNNELLSKKQSRNTQQDVARTGEGEEKRESQQKRPEVARREALEPAASPKRHKTEGKIHSSTALRAAHLSTRRGSILAERRRSLQATNVDKLDAIMQSNKRLEEMQRQQLEMLQQLCASDKVISIIAARKQNNESTKQSPTL